MKNNIKSIDRILSIGGILLVVGIFISSVCLLVFTLSDLSALVPPVRLPDDTNTLASEPTAVDDLFNSSNNTIILPVETVSPPEKEEAQTCLDISDFDAALTSMAEAFCDASALMQGYGNTSLFIEKGNEIYYVDFSSGYAIAKYDTTCNTKEYLVPSNAGSWIGDLQEQNGFLFYRAHSPSTPMSLYMLSCDGGDPILLFEDVEAYEAYGASLFIRTADTLVCQSISDPSKTSWLWKNTDSIMMEEFCVNDTGVVIELRSTSADPTRCLYHISPNGDTTLLYHGSNDFEMLQTTEDSIYFAYDDCSHSTTNYQLASIDCTQNGFPILLKNLEVLRPTTDSTLMDFDIIENQLFVLFSRDYSLEIHVADLYTMKLLEHYTYENLHGERTIDITTPCTFQLEKHHLYIQGKRYSDGIHTIVRIPRGTLITDCSNEEKYCENTWS